MTRSIPRGVALAALLVAFGCDGVFVLGDVVSSPEATGGSDGFGGSGGSGESDNSTPTAGGVTGNTASTQGNASGVSSATGSRTTSATVAGVGGDMSASTDGGGGASGDTSDGNTRCAPGPPPTAEAVCCGTGTHKRTLVFDAVACEYVLGPWTDCTVEGVCSSYEVDEEIRHCTNGGWRSRVRICNDTCEWGPWSEGECEGGADSCTGCACVSSCTDINTGGTTCKWIACDEAEARAECDQEIANICGTRNEPFTFKEWLPD